MRNLSVAVLLVLGLYSESSAQTPSDVADIRKAADARSVARRSGDADAYARLILDDALLTNSTGSLETKTERVKAVRGVKTTTPAPKLSDEKFRTYGTTVLRTFRQDGVDAQGQKTAQRWVEVWVKQGGQWKVAHVQFTNIANQ